MGIERLSEFWPEWTVLGVLGSGAFGKVYRAQRNESGFSIGSAIKVISIPSSEAEIDSLRSEGMTEEDGKRYFREIAEDFVNEIKVMNILRGAPNIVYAEAYNILEKHEGIGYDIFIRMELLTSFKDHLEHNDLSVSDVLDLGIDIASALEVCHSHNIIHRDIKPANIFVTDFGNYKLGDFGIAKELEKTSGALSSKGTPGFMAPEVARGIRYDRTVDIYSLGLVMYFLLNNKRFPFIDPYKPDVGYNDRRIANERRLAGEVLPAPCNATRELNALILTACAYEPKKRFQNATALKNALITLKGVYGNAVPAPSPTHAADPSVYEETVTVANMSRRNTSPSLQSDGVQPRFGFSQTTVSQLRCEASPKPSPEPLAAIDKVAICRKVAKALETVIWDEDYLSDMIAELGAADDYPDALELRDKCIARRDELKRLDAEYGERYEEGRSIMSQAFTPEEYDKAIDIFAQLKSYRDSENRLRICTEKLLIAKRRREDRYRQAFSMMNAAIISSDYDKPIEIFRSLGDFKESKKHLKHCIDKRDLLLEHYDEMDKEREKNLFLK